MFKILSLGSMMSGGNRNDTGDQPTDWNNPQGGDNIDPKQTENMPDRKLMMQAMQILQEAGGTVTDEVKSKILELGLTEEQTSMLSQTENGFSQRPGANMQNPAENNTNTTSNKANASPLFERRPTSTGTAESVLMYSGLFALLLLVTFFVAMKRRNY